MTQDEIQKILKNHQHWLKEDVEGWENMKAKLRDADLRGAKNIPFIPMVCPDEGPFIGWKKSREGYLIKLLIPEDAKRSSATTRKCRCSKAKVLNIYDLNEDKEVDAAYSRQEEFFLYKVGEMVYPDSFDENRWNECSHGIHFFINKQEAINYA